MTKLELYNYLNTVIDKSGSLKKENVFKNHYPDFYEEYCETEFPDEIKDLPFRQKLYHFLVDDYTIPVCVVCGKPVSFLTRRLQWGYNTFCSGSCAMQDEEIKKKMCESKLRNHGSSTYNNPEKRKKTLEQKPKVVKEKPIKERVVKVKPEKVIVEKVKKEPTKKIKIPASQLIDFGVLLQEKYNETHDTFFELADIKDKFEVYLNVLGIHFKRQYKSNMYPFECSFYLTYWDMYVEMNGDETKRNVAHENHLNYVELNSDDLDKCIEMFEDYLKDMLVRWCLRNELPGNTKWCSKHPIWDCFVGDRPTPNEAWKNSEYLRKALDNMFYMIHKNDCDDFRTKHMTELLKCQMVDNEIVDGTHKLLILIQNRFTISKLAPKVTAISANTVKQIVYDSGIDISRGVYVPMSGFGGIIEGCRQWAKEQYTEVDIECYDINPRLCEWYGWKQKDMLSEHVKTDKVVICCPPFGKTYEHWKGTPKTMSDTTFEEWYKLIQEYVEAPEYIIIGPEIDKTGTGSNKGLDGSGNKRQGLFAKTSGVMRWTDDMIKK